MRSPPETIARPLETLFAFGSYAGLSDGELLERFRSGQGEAREAAFTALITRHGPMVLALCRNVLDDPTDVHDAFQAVFLVLARRAPSIRKSEAVGSWLYGVTVRLAARARAASTRRQIRERRILAAAAMDRAGAEQGLSLERDENAAAIHDEVARLPERFRAPIVLCYFEGLTHEEAAARLSWPIGTVRSRLARARDRLRLRLTRRGLANRPAAGSLAAWVLAPHSSVPEFLKGHAAHLSDSAIRAVVPLTAAQSPAIGPAAMALAQGVMTAMTLRKLALAAGLMLTLGTAAGTGLAIGRGSGTQNAVPPAEIRDPPARPAEAPPRQDRRRELAQQLLAAATRRYETSMALYQAGDAGVSSLWDASQELAQAQILADPSAKARVEAFTRLVDCLKQMEAIARARRAAGSGTDAEVSGILVRRIEAEIQLQDALNQRDQPGMTIPTARRQDHGGAAAAKTEMPVNAEVNPALQELVEIARRRFQAQQKLAGTGKLAAGDLIVASRDLLRAELLAAQTQEERKSLRQQHLNRLKEVERRTQTLFQRGFSAQADLDYAHQARLEAELEMSMSAKEEATTAELLLRRVDELEQRVRQLEEPAGRR